MLGSEGWDVLVPGATQGMLVQVIMSHLPPLELIMVGLNNQNKDVSNHHTHLQKSFLCMIYNIVTRSFIIY